ncbi:uncharacterized protein LOC108165681 [Poecilia reticulata]|uniref:uncharacterized protein LOC108165681 n=1 Tax=Poecilia reticulata TaxID=8081 RepID=UPI0007EA39D8|nr:PREDICTED: uncharacterized protein LOC108165681 [Poecilia reticulata]
MEDGLPDVIYTPVGNYLVTCSLRNGLPILRRQIVNLRWTYLNIRIWTSFPRAPLVTLADYYPPDAQVSTATLTVKTIFLPSSNWLSARSLFQALADLSIFQRCLPCFIQAAAALSPSKPRVSWKDTSVNKERPRTTDFPQGLASMRSTSKLSYSPLKITQISHDRKLTISPVVFLCVLSVLLPTAQTNWHCCKSTSSSSAICPPQQKITTSGSSIYRIG